jgi:ABC-type antimicrobial peptide transport system permease subunit
MFKNYFKTAWRSLWKNKFYSLVNISGLAVGLATGIMLLMWVQKELSYDKFNKGYKNIYQLSAHFVSNGEAQTWPGVPGPLAVYAKNIPEVQSIVRIQKEDGQVLSDKSGERIFNSNTVASVDSGFFAMFIFKFIEGKKDNAFPNLYSVVITESTAKKLFGDKDAIGKPLVFYKTNFTVTGVLQNFPDNSTLKFDAIFPMGFYARIFTSWGGNGDWKTIDEDVGNYAFNTFVKLQPGADPVKTGDTFSALYKKARNGDSNAAFKLENLGDIHLIGADGNNAALRMVQIFMLIAILLLSIASINYVNLSTARSLMRAKEVGVRKIIGASKMQLFSQFTLETLVLFVFAAVLALILIYILMPLYNEVSGKALTFNFTNITVWKAIALAVLGTIIASSIYPALLLSSFKPIESLKGKFKSGIGIASLRKGLVVFQFSISVILLVCTIIISRQMDYIRNKNLGYDKSYVFSVPLPDEVVNHLDAVEAELGQQTSISNVAASDAENISNLYSSTGDIDWKGKPANSNMLITQLKADKNFIPLMRMKFVEGTNFTGSPADSSYYVLNETAVKQMDLKTPYVGQQIRFHDRKGTILGVVKDFNFQSLKTKIGPIIFFNFWNKPNLLYIRTTAANAQHAIAAVASQYKKYAGSIPFSYNFLDKSFDDLYRSEQRSGVLFNVFAGIAIFISCLGLFGLSTYTAQVKRKEIGIRKVLGASISGIVQLITIDFLKLVFLAIIIAIPVSWWAVNSWLDDFAYRINVHWWVFGMAGLAALLISLVTISFQAIKAAISNPVNSIRAE